MRKWLLFFIIAASAVRSLAGANDSIPYPKLDKSYLKSYYYDTRNLLFSPASWGSKQWITLGVVVGAGALAYSQDADIQAFFADHQSHATGNISKYIFEPFGNGKFSPVIIGGLYLGGFLAKDKRLAGTSLAAAKALFVSSVFTQAIKQITHRHRPFQDEIPDRADWDGPFSKTSFNSFPSGHATAAFSLATVFAFEYRKTVWIPCLAYTLATGTAISRLYDNKHWASDVVIGSAIGFFTGRFMWKQSRKTNHRCILLPSLGKEATSLTLFLRL